MKAQLSWWPGSLESLGDGNIYPVILGERFGARDNVICLLNEELKNPQNPQNHRVDEFW